MVEAPKHTPGPWTAKWSRYRDGTFIVQAGAPSNRVLASFDGDGDGPDDQSIADARLIAENAKAAIWEMDTWIAEAESYLSALAAPSAVAGDGLVERLQRPWDGSSGSRDRRDAERREAATLITELQAKVARMEVEAFDAAIAHGKTKLALAKSEASREAAEAMVAEARKVINELIRTCRPEPIIFDTGEAALRAARTWMEGGR